KVGLLFKWGGTASSQSLILLDKTIDDLEEEISGAGGGGAMDGAQYTYREATQTRHRKAVEEAENIKRFEDISDDDLVLLYGRIFFDQCSGFGDRILNEDPNSLSNIRRELFRREVDPERLKRIEKEVSDPGTLGVGASSANRDYTH